HQHDVGSTLQEGAVQSQPLIRATSAASRAFPLVAAEIDGAFTGDDVDRAASGDCFAQFAQPVRDGRGGVENLALPGWGVLIVPNGVEVLPIFPRGFTHVFARVETQHPTLIRVSRRPPVSNKSRVLVVDKMHDLERDLTGSVNVAVNYCFGL